ncbi:RNA polymerase sigma factor [Paenibacillus sp. Marseille-Q4541]|uniref:RNA polymerase sigma factor n=1 Tax=Paenibacillus sp. Marseille-Q4541 TaxID=2831522 RepID=UPI001BAD9B3F|nr:RNA polymerase sigma factor [Paenibacillus sp. Marseille-Q4541]
MVFVSPLQHFVVLSLRKNEQEQSQTQTQSITEGIHRSLYQYCLSLTGSKWDAEDLCQDTCLRVLLQMPELINRKVPFTLEAYLIRTARNAWIDAVRKDKRRRELREVYQSGEADLAVTTESMEESLQLEEVFRMLLTDMTDWQRTIYLLCEIYGYKAQEAAELLDSSEGAVKAALYRARQVVSSIANQAVQVNEIEQVHSVQTVLSPEEEERLKAYLGAFRSGDTKRLVELGLGRGEDEVVLMSQVLNSYVSGSSNDIDLCSPNRAMMYSGGYSNSGIVMVA